MDIPVATVARNDARVPPSVLPTHPRFSRSTESPLPLVASGAPDSIRVVIVHAQRLVRAGIAALLERGDGIEVVGEAASGEEALGLARRLRPDVVLIDVALDRGPAELIRAVRLEARQRHRRRPTLRLIEGERRWNSVT
jgi:PleD family two-component response regulator